MKLALIVNIRKTSPVRCLIIIDIWLKQLRVKLTPSNPHLYSNKKKLNTKHLVQMGRVPTVTGKKMTNHFSLSLSLSNRSTMTIPFYCRYLYTDWQTKRYNQNQFCFIQAVISSYYVEINQHKLLAVSCFEGISNFVQRYHQTGVNQGRNLTSRMPRLSSNFQKTWIHWKIKKERDNHG